MKLVEALLIGNRLSLTHLGRSLRSKAFVKHNIKCADRLLGNKLMHRDRVDIYRAMARWLVAPTSQPAIIVDWSDCEERQDYMMLKAALPVGGRAVSVYEEVHPRSGYNSQKAHKQFLHNLSSVLPEGCRPIIITDAGFRRPWFREVERLGWDWVGRVHYYVKFSLDKTKRWRYTRTLHPSATPTPRYVGYVWLSKRDPYACHLYLVRKYHRGPGRPRKRHGRNVLAQLSRKRHKEPWVIATSLSHTKSTAKRIIKLYGLRMQIEETFRDLKGHRWGLGLKYARSCSTRRLEILLLIGTLAMLVSWLVGLAANMNDWARFFQANTVRSRAVLSVCFLGQQLFRTSRFLITRKGLLDAANLLPNLAMEQAK